MSYLPKSKQRSVVKDLKSVAIPKPRLVQIRPNFAAVAQHWPTQTSCATLANANKLRLDVRQNVFKFEFWFINFQAL